MPVSAIRVISPGTGPWPNTAQSDGDEALSFHKCRKGHLCAWDINKEAGPEYRVAILWQTNEDKERNGEFISLLTQWASERTSPETSPTVIWKKGKFSYHQQPSESGFMPLAVGSMPLDKRTNGWISYYLLNRNLLLNIFFWKFLFLVI